MGRAPRADEAGKIDHALYRGDATQHLFFNDADWEAFERITAEGLDLFPVDLIAWQWMKISSDLQQSFGNSSVRILLPSIYGSEARFHKLMKELNDWFGRDNDDPLLVFFKEPLG